MDFYFYASKILQPLILPSNFLFFSFIFCLFFYFWKKKEIFKKIFYIIFAIFLCISLFPVGKNLLYYGLEKNYKINKIPENIDYIFVPSGSNERIVKAIKIKNDYFPKNVKIIYSGGNSNLDVQLDQDHENDFFREIIANSTIDKKDLVLLPKARNTIENFEQLSLYLLNDKSKKILLVTDSFHMRRCFSIAKKYKIRIEGFYPSIPIKNNSFSIINYYQSINFIHNLQLFDIFFREIMGILAIEFFI